MAQINISIKCRLCDEQMKIPAGSGPWEFMENLGSYMVEHDRCERMAEKLAQKKEQEAEVKELAKEMGATDADRPAES